LKQRSVKAKAFQGDRRLRFDILVRSGKASSSGTGLKLGLKLAAPPSGKDEVNPGEDVTG
jgi:hypothetical protein